MKVFLLLVVLLLGGGAFLIYSGFYDVAASDPHTPAVRWVLETTRDHSIRRYAAKAPPPPPREAADIEEGFRRYDEMCIICHSAPGHERSEISKGLNPEPPELAEEEPEWSRDELFWIVKHGFKMSGMPAFSPTHSDKAIGDIVAFLERLPEMSPREYRKMRVDVGGEGNENGPSEPRTAQPEPGEK